MTVDRPTPISSGYLKAFSTGHEREKGLVLRGRELGTLVPSLPTLFVSPTPTQGLCRDQSSPDPAPGTGFRKE